MNSRMITAIKSAPENTDMDGCRGILPSTQAQNNAVSFLASLPKYYQEVIQPEDHVTPQANGTITIDWYFRKQFVSMDIGDTKVGFFSDFSDGLNSTSVGEPDVVRPKLVAALNKLYGRDDK